MSILVITHRADFDGLCSQAIARRALADSATYLGWDYSDDVPNLAPYDTIYLIDISLPKDVMIANASRLIWIDHHISKMTELDGVDIQGYRIDGVAACRLAWQWFNDPKYGTSTSKAMFLNREVVEPYAVQILGEYDIWDKRNPDVDPFQLGMSGQPVIDWETLLRAYSDDKMTAPYGYLRDILASGYAIQSYVKQTNLDIVTKFGFDVEWEGMNLLALNTSKSSSLIFDGTIKPHHDGCLAYRWDGKMWRASLYGVPDKDVDMTLIAKKYGGGGHRGAAGFSFAELPPELGRAPCCCRTDGWKS